MYQSPHGKIIAYNAQTFNRRIRGFNSQETPSPAQSVKHVSDIRVSLILAQQGKSYKKGTASLFFRYEKHLPGSVFDPTFDIVVLLSAVVTATT